MKETVEVVAPARITAEKERNLVNIQSLSPKKKKKKKKEKKNFFSYFASFVCWANETRLQWLPCID